MPQNASWSLEGLDPDTRDAAKEAARRSGMTLDEWVATTIAGRAYTDAPPVKRRPVPVTDDLDAATAKLARAARGKVVVGGASRDLDSIIAAAVEKDRRARADVAKTATALSSVAEWIERAEDRLSETARVAGERQERTTAVLGEALGLMTRRLDEIERKVVEGHQPSTALALAAVEKIENHLARVNEAGRAQAESAKIEAALRGFEERIAGITERLAAAQQARPIGRRGLTSQDEVRNAVAEIRSRQSELEAPPAAYQLSRLPGATLTSGASAPRSHAEILHSLRGDIARLAGQLDTVRPPEGATSAVEGLREEIGGLRRSMGALATRDEIGALERTVREVTRHVAEAGPQGTDFRAVTAPIEELQAEVRRLADVVAAGVHGRLALDFEALARKVDGVRSSGVDPHAVDGLSQQLADVRRTLGEIAEPQRVHALSEQMAELSRQVAQIGRAQIDNLEFASLKASVDEIRAVMRSGRSGDALTTAQQIGTVSAKLDALAERIAQGEPGALGGQIEALSLKLDGVAQPQEDLGALNRRLDALTQQLDRRGEDGAPDLARHFEALSAKLDRVADAPGEAVSREIERFSTRMESALASAGGAVGFDDLLRRLDRLDESLRQPKEPGLKPIEDMLRTLADRLDQAERPGADLDALDALEKQVATISQRLDRAPDGDPALSALERAMGDLMAQIGGMREGTFEAAERAVKSTLSALPAGSAPGPELGTLKHDLADLKAHYNAADKRNRDTLEAVHGTLEKLVQRLASLEQGAPPARGDGSRVKAGVAQEPPARDAKREAARADEHFIKQIQSAARAQAAAAPELSLAEADRPLPPAGEEILLEPGAAPPRPDQPSAAVDAPAGEAAGSAASLIAAARRAAQAAHAAAAENASAGRGNGVRGLDLGAIAGTASSPANLASRMKEVVERRRRPLLLGAGAIVLAIATIQLVGGMLGGSSPAVVATMPEPKAALPAEPAEARTTQALAKPPAQPSGKEVRTVLPAPTPPAARAEQGSDVKNAADSAAGLGDNAKTPDAKPDAVKVEAKAAEPAAPAPNVPLQVASLPDPAMPAPVAGPQAAEPLAPIPNMAAIGDIPASAGPAGLRQAVLAGDPVAVFDLAARAADGRGMMRDVKLAARLFERAAAHGLVPAQYRIGNHYEKGLGVPRDLALAKLWYQRAAEKGNARAMHNLAVLLAEGAGSKPDYTSAVEWFRRAAEHGVRDSQFNLAVLLARGLGTQQDLPGSYTWFSIAAAQGDTDAAAKREEVGGRLLQAELATARSAAERWKPEIPPTAANDVVLPANGWTEAPAKPKDKAKTAKI